MSGTAVALVLNATYEPLCVVPGRRAAVLVLTEKAVPVSEGDGLLRSSSTLMVLPAVVRLTRFVRVPFRPHVTLTRRAVFARDGGRCVYCGHSASTIDHVLPRSRGGHHTWDNVVAACGRCNHVKADRMLTELGWRLRQPPTAPTGVAWRVLGHRTPDPRWLNWLGLPEQESA
ncbi:MAG: endonuclease [Actinomycetia bacterium]|jgi:5-methylcytosine-specific restriction endonuclease McrA|nr:endonuclease [Actinomycetes bacterium]